MRKRGKMRSEACETVRRVRSIHIANPHTSQKYNTAKREKSRNEQECKKNIHGGCERSDCEESWVGGMDSMIGMIRTQTLRQSKRMRKNAEKKKREKIS